MSASIILSLLILTQYGRGETAPESNDAATMPQETFPAAAAGSTEPTPPPTTPSDLRTTDVTTNEEKSTTYRNMKCDTSNTTEEFSLSPSRPDSIYLNNINSVVTTSLLGAAGAGTGEGGEGVSLFEVAARGCGGARVCGTGGAGGWRVDEPGTITVGFLAAYGRSQIALGALPLAVAAVNRERALLPGRRLRFVAADIGRPWPALPRDRDTLALRVMTQMRDLGVVAFFGPDGSCHTEAKLAAAWNLPLISHKCAGAAGADAGGAGLGATFARTLPPAYKVSKSVVALLRAYRWHKFALVAQGAPSEASQQCDAIKELAARHGMSLTHERRFTDYIPRHIAHMRRIVDETHLTTRVYVFLGEHIALLDFVRALRERGLLPGRGEYAVVAVTDEIYDPSAAAGTPGTTGTAGTPGSPDTPDTADKQQEQLGENSTEEMMSFRAVLRLTPSYPTNPHYPALCKTIRELSAAPPFCVPNYHKLFDTVSVPIEAAHLYDAVTLWARAATAALRAGRPPTDGAALMRLLRPTTYTSVQGFDVYMDEGGDAEGNFTVVCVARDAAAPAGWRVRPVATFRYQNATDPLPVLVGGAGAGISWVGGAPPAAEPACGFSGARCGRGAPHDPALVSAALAAAAAALLAAALLLRHYRYEQKLASVLWRIEAKELTFIPPAAAAAAHTPSKGSTSHGAEGEGQGEGQGEGRRAHTSIALCRGNIVAIKRLHKKNIDITRAISKELKQIRELRHENLNAIVGVCVESGAACIVSAYCSRGSLARVLADRELHLDAMFVSSLVADLLRGLTFLHESPLHAHGRLTSRACLVDSRWVLQIADYGLHQLRSGCAEGQDALRAEARMLWQAPELLRAQHPASPGEPAPRGTQRGDVYSFGIVLYEILGRNGPWGDTNLTNAEIIGRVRQPIGGVLFRPPLGALAARPSVLAVLRACWSERPDARPDLRLVRLRLKDMHAGMKTNIFDNMLAMMEKYASNLEALVAARTDQLVQEKRRTDHLLHRMLPRTVAEALKRGERVRAESFACVTIYFSDIVAFTEMAAAYSPMQVVDILNDLYTCMDDIISIYNVYKVETIGDAYMVVGGLGEGGGGGSRGRRGGRHVAEVASLALHVLEAVPRLCLRVTPPPQLRIRIGIHSGQVAAGVVGSAMPRYCLFGDAVNTAARMQSSGEPQRAHVSHDTYLLLQADTHYHFEERGLVDIKGKGKMKTWWLVSEDYKRRTKTEQPFLSEQAPGESAGAAAGGAGADIRERAWLSCGPARAAPRSTLSSPGPPPAPACACVVPPRAHHSAPAVSFCDDL